ncbi:MAG: fibronectin type III domain-containing protein, partial [Leadbetterella sp.]
MAAYKKVSNELIIKGSDLIDDIVTFDSLPNVNSRYLYRLIGKTYFDEYIVSDSVAFDYYSLANTAPNLKLVKKLTSAYEVAWTLPKTPENMRPDTMFTSFSIQVSKNDTANFKTVLSNINPLDTTNMVSFSSVLSKIDTSTYYYFIVKGYGKGGDSLTSIPFIIMPIDKTPPAKPVNLIIEEVTNDNLNATIVKLSWSPNTESDLAGYRVFRRVGNEEEAFEISDTLSVSVILRDTLSKKMEYPTIKYYVIAVDNRFNQSDSAIVIYNKKDTRPPISPLISGFNVLDLNVKLFLQKSPDDDIETYFLYRKKVNDPTSLTLVATFTQTNIPKIYTDTDLENKQTYIYWIYAKDFSGNESCYKPNAVPQNCFQLVPVKVVSTKRSPIVVFEVEFDVSALENELKWQYDTTGMEYFEVFRSAKIKDVVGLDSTYFSSWRTLSPSDLSTRDEKVNFNSQYYYGIKAFFDDGTSTSLTKIKIITPNDKLCVLGKMSLNKFELIEILTPIVDTACYEINLNEGFETATDGDYTAEIKEE